MNRAKLKQFAMTNNNLTYGTIITFQVNRETDFLQICTYIV